MSIENAEILKLVARLVVGYLDEQNLSDAHKSFCETSRHLSQEEYLAFSQGIRAIDTSIGLINIVSEYFYIKNKLNDFIRNCPKTSLIIKLIDTSSFLLRFDIIFKVLRDNLQKIDKSEVPESRKRKLNEDELFNISNTNTSTPETIVQCPKRQRISFSRPLIPLSAKKTSSDVTKEKVNDDEILAGKNKKELKYISSPETSNKEDDVSEEEDEVGDVVENSNKIAVPPPELLSETVLRKTDFVENLAEIINQTRCAKEFDQSLEASSSPKPLTDNDFQEIISKTENDFEDILSEVIGKYLGDGEIMPPTIENKIIQPKPEEIPIKQRLRPRIAKKQPISEKKKKKSSINVISNEIYTGPLPLCLQLPSTSGTTNISSSINTISSTSNQVIIPETIDMQSSTQQSLVLNLVPIMPQIQPIVPTTTTTFIPLSSNGNIVCESSAMNVEIPQNVQIIVSEKKNSPEREKAENENLTVESTQQTPKVPIQANFLASKCKSTPRRKASHIRILDFNQTPSVNRLTTIKEFQTPNSSGIKLETPGSAPASITVEKSAKKIEVKKILEKAEEAKENLDVSLEIVDESSNSNSISNTPKVAKNRRRRKIEIDVKSEKNLEEESPKPMTREEWLQMRAEQKAMSVDDRMRILFQQQNEQKISVKKRKTPKKKLDSKKQPPSAKLKKSSSVTLTDQQGKKLLCAKFKVTSPRKAALLKKTPKKKKIKSSPIDSKLIVNTIINHKNDEKKINDNRSSENLPKLNDTPTIENKNDAECNDLNRSDTVQEVANLLTNLPETILAKTNSFDHNAQQELIDSKILMETPLKLDSISPLPNTPRFAVPLVSIHQETPLTKAITTTIPTAVSVLKVCDILTPSFPITPGFKETPLKNDQSPGTASASGYSSRRTDYSSCSSYYKPDESEEINQNLEMVIKQCRGSEKERNSQSESDGGSVALSITSNSKTDMILRSAKKIECPGALERVQSFKEDTARDLPMPHYTMLDEEGLLSESMLTTASDDTSTSFTCSTCSTDPTSDENTLDMLNKSENLDDRDSEWQCDDIEIEKECVSNNSLVDEKTGEVRFPLRNWITPKKVEPELPKEEDIVNKSSEEVIVQSEELDEEQKKDKKKKNFPDLEAIKQRTLKIIKSESAVNSKKIQPKMKKSNVKTFKLPPEQPKAVPLTRRDQILQQNLTERPRPTPLKLISSSHALSSSSSRRKNATPRKTIIIDELPKAPSPTKKTRVKSKSQERRKVENTSGVKTPIKPERVSLENISDNAVSNDDHPSLNISTSFNDSSEEENTVVKIADPKLTRAATVTIEEGSNTFQKTLIAQGFDKKDAKDLQVQLVDKIEHEQKVLEKDEKDKIESESKSEEEDDDDEEECDFAFSDVHEKFTFNFEEPNNFKAPEGIKSLTSLCSASKLQIDGKIIKIDFNDPVEIFSMEPTFNAAAQDNKNEDKIHKGKESPKTESIILTKEIEIDKILTLIHGKH